MKQRCETKQSQRPTLKHENRLAGPTDDIKVQRRQDRSSVYFLINERNSSLVFAWSRKQPSMQLVIVVAPGFCTPRIAMHMCLRSRTDTKREIYGSAWEKKAVEPFQRVSHPLTRPP